jgi:hypothetical protein
LFVLLCAKNIIGSVDNQCADNNFFKRQAVVLDSDLCESANQTFKKAWRNHVVQCAPEHYNRIKTSCHSEYIRNKKLVVALGTMAYDLNELGYELSPEFRAMANLYDASLVCNSMFEVANK